MKDIKLVNQIRNEYADSESIYYRFGSPWKVTIQIAIQSLPWKITNPLRKKFKKELLYLGSFITNVLIYKKGVITC